MRPYILVLAIVLVSIAATTAAQSSSPTIVHQDEFFIVGIAEKTTGEAEMSGDGVIPGMWQKFAQERVLEKIPNRVDGSVYALYTDFSRDRMGAYTVVIGAKVKDKAHVPDGMVLKTVPAGQYAVITSEKGPGATVIPTAWQKVAALEDKDRLGGKRAYKADFEVYDQRQTDPQNLQADLYVGLKSTTPSK